MIRLETIRVDPNGPKFARPHPKGEIIWARQYDPGWEPANLTEYPQIGQEILAWREGVAEARQLALRAGMGVGALDMFVDGDDPPDPPDLSWAVHPFQCPDNDLQSMCNARSSNVGGPDPDDSDSESSTSMQSSFAECMY